MTLMMRHELVRVHISSAVVYILESVPLYATLIGSGTSSALELHKAEPSRARESAISLPVIFEWPGTQHSLTLLFAPSNCRVWKQSIVVLDLIWFELSAFRAAYKITKVTISIIYTVLLTLPFDFRTIFCKISFRQFWTNCIQFFRNPKQKRI